MQAGQQELDQGQGAGHQQLLAKQAVPRAATPPRDRRLWMLIALLPFALVAAGAYLFYQQTRLQAVQPQSVGERSAPVVADVVAPEPVIVYLAGLSIRVFGPGFFASRLPTVGGSKTHMMIAMIRLTSSPVPTPRGDPPISWEPPQRRSPRRTRIGRRTRRCGRASSSGPASWAPASCTESLSNRYLTLPNCRAGEQEIGDVDAGDEKHEADDSQNDEERRSHLFHQVVVNGENRHSPAFDEIVVFR